MSLEDWLKSNLIQKHRTSPNEIASLFHICDRDLETVKIPELGPDWRLSIAHNAVVQAAKIALAAKGYRARKEGQHYLLIHSLAFTIGTDPHTIKKLDKFRKKRNISDYETSGLVTKKEAEEMIELARKIYEDVKKWLKIHYPNLLGGT